MKNFFQWYFHTWDGWWGLCCWGFGCWCCCWLYKLMSCLLLWEPSMLACPWLGHIWCCCCCWGCIWGWGRLDEEWWGCEGCPRECWCEEDLECWGLGRPYWSTWFEWTCCWACCCCPIMFGWLPGFMPGIIGLVVGMLIKDGMVLEFEAECDLSVPKPRI